MNKQVFQAEYAPSKKILDKYAAVLVNYALGGGQGIKTGDVVYIMVPESAKPMLGSLEKAVLLAGGNPIIHYLPEGNSKQFYTFASDEQVAFFPEKLLKGRLEQIDHSIAIIAQSDKHELKGVDAKKIMLRQKSAKPYMEWRNKKEIEGKFTWTLALYGTEAMAKEVGMTPQMYWKQIINACFLTDTDPVKTWKKVQKAIETIKEKLNKLDIEYVHVKSKNTDLKVRLGKNRKWLGGSGRNIPSFELFISPDWRGTQGHIFIDQPLYRYGTMVQDIYLEFNNGVVTKATAKKGEKILREMIAVENADKIGEFSLTDVRFSKITKFMAETLYDENVGGKYGNTHVALGSAYRDSYTGEAAKVAEKAWQDMGYNTSAIHTDVISTENRVVTAYLANGKIITIYRDGMFLS